MANLTEVRVPDLGDFKDVPVIDVLVKEGDTIEVDTPLVTLETEKATMDVPSSAAGRVAALKVRKGGKVSQGSVIAIIEAAEAEAGSSKRETAPATSDVEETVRQPPFTPEVTVPRMPATAPAATATRPAAEPVPAQLADLSRAHASPSVRMFARELGVELVRVQGSGLKARITHADVKAFIKRVMTEGAPATAAGLPTRATGRLREVRPDRDTAAQSRSSGSRARDCMRAGSTSRT